MVTGPTIVRIRKISEQTFLQLVNKAIPGGTVTNYTVDNAVHIWSCC